MNILFVTNYYPSVKHPQFCIFIEQQAQALKKLGHQIEVIVPKSSSKKKFVKRSLSGITVYDCNYFSLYKEIFCCAILYLNIRSFEEYFDFSQYDVISVHMFHEYTLRIFNHIAKKYGNKLILHYHGLSVLYDNPIPLHVNLLQRRGDRSLLRLVSKADAIVGVSQKVCERIKEYLPNIQLFTVYNGVDTNLFVPSDKKSSNAFTIISVASLKRIKGNHYLIDAVSLLIEKYKKMNIKLIIIGKGPEKAALLSQVKRLHMEPYVHFKGLILYEEVAHVMRQCDVFAMPSYYEALGCAYLEAMACRLPAIGCKYQGIDEIITDGQNGLLVEPHNVRQIFSKLDYLLQNPQRSSEIAAEGYHTVVEGYTWQDSALRLLEVYRMILMEG
jgi:glycosyltransferase involved in cell wall biosynthesis